MTGEGRGEENQAAQQVAGVIRVVIGWSQTGPHRDHAVCCVWRTLKGASIQANVDTLMKQKCNDTLLKSVKITLFKSVVLRL